jgi:hypothetical protein
MLARPRSYSSFITSPELCAEQSTKLKGMAGSQTAGSRSSRSISAFKTICARFGSSFLDCRGVSRFKEQGEREMAWKLLHDYKLEYDAPYPPYGFTIVATLVMLDCSQLIDPSQIRYILWQTPNRDFRCLQGRLFSVLLSPLRAHVSVTSYLKCYSLLTTATSKSLQLIRSEWS